MPDSIPSAVADKDGGQPIQTVAVIGAGDLGRAFAIACAEAGFDVMLEDVMPARLRAARHELAALQGVLGQVQLVTTVEDAVREADVAIDFVPDELESKLEIFSLIDRMAPPKTILCTPTHELSITDLASCTYRPALCVALDGVPGVPGEARGETTRVIRGKATGARTTARVVQWLRALTTSVEVVDDDRIPLFTAKVPVGSLGAV